MASYLVQAGTTLSLMSVAGVATPITLPTGVTLLGATTPCRVAVFGTTTRPIIAVVNGASHDFWIDYAGVARRMQVTAPVAAPTPTAGVGTGLTGTYSVACTFKVKDPITGETLIESAMGPISTGVALVNKTLRIDSTPVSGDVAVNARGIYRTLNGGTTLYPWFDIDNNTLLFEDRGGADTTLSLTIAAALRYGAPPDLSLIASWRDRLWGAPRLKPDYVRWTEDRNFYAWSADNELVAPPQYTDNYGVTALIPRRDALGITRRRRLYMVVGNSNDTFQRLGVSESLGCVSQESVVIKDNVAFMLGENSVNMWSDNGIVSISDAQVAAWFSSDTYFNRALFPTAKARYNHDTEAYEVLVALAGTTTADHWVSYQLKTKTWMGPHKTDAFTPTGCGTTSAMRGTLSDANNLQLAVFGGSDGYLYKRDTAVANDSGVPVAFSIALPPLACSEPDFEKFFDRPTIHTRAEVQGTLVVTPTVGNLIDIPQATMAHDLTLDRETLPRLGNGRYCQLTLSHTVPSASRYAARVLLDGATGDLRFGDVAGATTAADSIGANPGMLYGGVTFGQVGPLADGSKAALFDGTSGYVASALVIPATPTVEAWVYPTAVGNFLRIFSAGANFPFELAIGNDQALYFFLNFTSLTPGWTSTGFTLPLNTWSLVEATWDGTTYRVDVNGATVYSNAVWAGRTLLSGTAFVGGVVGGGSYWIGRLAEVAVYPSALTLAQDVIHYGLRTATTERPRIYGLELPFNVVGRR